MTTAWSRNPLRHSRDSGDNVKSLHQLSKCCSRRCQSVILCLQLYDGRNPQFSCAVLHILFTEVVGSILPSRLSQFGDHHLLLPRSLDALLDHFGDRAHHPAGFIIFLFHILPIIGTCKITQNVFDSSHISSSHFSGSLDVNADISACVKSSCACQTAASASTTRFLAPAVSPSTESSIRFSFSSLLKKCVSRHFYAATLFLDLKLHNAPRARFLSASKPLFPSLA